MAVNTVPLLLSNKRHEHKIERGRWIRGLNVHRTDSNEE